MPDGACKCTHKEVFVQVPLIVLKGLVRGNIILLSQGRAETARFRHSRRFKEIRSVSFVVPFRTYLATPTSQQVNASSYVPSFNTPRNGGEPTLVYTDECTDQEVSKGVGWSVYCVVGTYQISA